MKDTVQAKWRKCPTGGFVAAALLLLVFYGVVSNFVVSHDIGLTPIPGTPEGDAYLRYRWIHHSILAARTPVYLLTAALFIYACVRYRRGGPNGENAVPPPN